MSDSRLRQRATRPLATSSIACNSPTWEWRDTAARQMVRKSGALGRLTRTREEFFPQLDREHLSVCSACREIVFPTPGETRDDLLSLRCHYCNARERLKPYGEDNPNRTVVLYG